MQRNKPRGAGAKDNSWLWRLTERVWECLFGGCDNHLSCEKESEKSDLGGAEGHLGLPLSKVGTSQPSQTHDHVKKATTAVIIFRASLLNQFRPYIRSQLHPSHGADLLVFWFLAVSGLFCSHGRALKASPVCEVLCSATGMCPHFVWAGKESFLFIHSICLQYMLKGEEDQGSLSLPHHRVWCLPLPLHLPWTLWNSHWWWVPGNQNSSFGFSCFFLPGQDSPETCPICAPIGSSFWNYGSSFCQVFCNAWDYFGLLLFVASGQPAQYLQQFVPEVNDIAWRGLVKMVSLFLLYYYWNPHGVLEMLSWHIIADWAAMMPCCKFYFMWYFRAVWWWLVFVEIVLMECYCLCKYFSIASCRKLHKYAPGFWINIVPKKQ